MSRLIKLLILASILVVLCRPAHAQIINAASCSASDVSKALSSVNQATATVVIPAGTCQWTTNLTYAAPSAVTSLTIQGQTTCTGSGDPAQNNLACTDATIIQDNDTTHSNSLISLSSNGFIRWTGITVEAGSGITKNSGYFVISSGGSIRIDHSHFNGDTFTGATPDSDYVEVGGCTVGVVDHSIFTTTGAESGFAITDYNGQSCNGTSNGDGSFAAATGFGTSNAIFVEQNLFQNNSNAGSRQANDCVLGGRGVFRFNTFNNGAHLQTHPTGNAGQQRGCRMTEVYANQWVYNMGANYVNTLFFFSSGTALVWGNTAQRGYGSFVQLTDCRSGSDGAGHTRCGYPNIPAPNGWGLCGSSSPWDGNTNGSGYPCIDQAGRGQSDLLTGAFPSKVNSVKNTIAWPNQKLEPLYFWLNSYSPLGNGNGSDTPVIIDGSIWTQNQDYYISSDQNSGKDCNGFTGATGIGCGPRSSRPSTCTAGVAWWSADQGSWNQSGNGFGNGVLDICTSSNTWTNASYAPYTYPHPLANGSAASPPAAPTNIQISVN